MVYRPRSAWTTEPNRAPQIRSAQTTIYLHYPGQPKPIGASTVEGTAARLRAYRRMHVAGQYSEIAYNYAVDGRGDVWELRGDRQCGGNGGTASNRTGQAILLLVGNSETPGPALIRGVLECIARIQGRHTTAKRIRGHRESPDASTACPGDTVMALIRQGAFSASVASPVAPAAPSPSGSFADLAGTQQKLAALGYQPGPADGVLGTRTEAAVIAYQADAGLLADGRPGPTTRKALDQDMSTLKNLDTQIKALSKQVADIPRLTMQIQVPLEGDQKGQSSNLTGVRKWYAHDIARIVRLLGEIKTLITARRLSDAEVDRIAEAVAKKRGS